MAEKYPKCWRNDFADLVDTNFKPGVMTIKVTSWGQFRDVANRLLEKRNYLWRGQRCCGPDWDLKSSFDRCYSGKSRETKLAAVLRRFTVRLNDLGRSASPPSAEDDSMWALGQHYGLPTPLLDWTTDPYFALYFAFWQRRRRGESGPRVIYALNPVVQRLILKPSRKRLVEFPTVALPRSTRNQKQNRRLRAQRGRFTRVHAGGDVAANIAKLAAKKPLYEEAVILAEILVPTDRRSRWLQQLERQHRINHARLFPDLAGAAEATRDFAGLWPRAKRRGVKPSR